MPVEFLEKLLHTDFVDGRLVMVGIVPTLSQEAEMIAGILIIASSSILFVYWLRFSCLLLLRSAAERAGAKSVDARFNVARVIEGLKTEADLAPLERAL